MATGEIRPQIEDKSLKHAKKRFILSLIFLIAGIIYLISPIDLIPDILVPIGWVDDISILIGTFIFSAYAYHKVKKERRSVPQPDIK